MYYHPPPPYEVALQRDRKVPDQLALRVLTELPKAQDEEWNDLKHSRGHSEKIPRNSTFPRLSRRIASLENLRQRAPRPLPPSPVGAHLSAPPGQGSKLSPIAEIKTNAAQSDSETDSPHSPAPPPFSVVVEHVPDQRARRPSTSNHPSPMHYQSSKDAPRRQFDGRTQAVAFPSVPPRQSSYSPPQIENDGARLAFDPSVAYSSPQTCPRTEYPTHRRAAGSVSLYSCAVSYLSLDSPTSPGLRQFHTPAQVAPWNAEASWLDHSDARSVRSSFVSGLPSTRTPRRPRTSGGYEYSHQRWASSDVDMTKDIYHG